jgi:hypothetical protein
MMYGVRVGVLAAWLVALSPFVISLAPTALTDPLLVALVLAGSVAAGQGRVVRAGIWFGLVLLTKQQGLFFLPLGVMLLGGNVARATPRPFFPTWTRATLIFLLMTTLTFLPVLIWEAVRAQSPGVWQLSLINYGGVSTAITNMGERGGGFMALLSYGTASPVLNAIFVGGLPLLLLFDLGEISQVRSSHPPSTDSSNPIYADLALTVFIILFLAGHILLSFQVWDRYLLGLMPLLALFSRVNFHPVPLLIPQHSDEGDKEIVNTVAELLDVGVLVCRSLIAVHSNSLVHHVPV